MKNMIIKLYMKNLILLLVVSVLCITGYAQSSNVSNTINKIKRDSKTYFYAESTSASEAEAKEAATVMLQSLVSDHNKQSGCSVDFNSLDIQYLQMMRGEYHRVFAYARRDGAKTESIKVETPAPTPVAATPTATLAPVVAPINEEPAQAVNTELATENDILQQELAEKERQLKELQEKLEAQQREAKRLAQMSSNNNTPTVANPTDENIATSNHSYPTQNPSATGGRQYQQNVIDALLQCANLNEVSNKLSRFQNEYKVKKYGTYDDCPNIASCYWIVINRDSDMSMNTILSTGNDKTNLRTSHPDSLSKYTGHILIWFRL